MRCDGKTGVEMEALTAATVAGLTLYDMCKGVDKKMMLGQAYVARKSGGKSGGWTFKPGKDEQPLQPKRGHEMAQMGAELAMLRARRVGSVERLRELLRRVERREGKGVGGGYEEGEGWDETHGRVGVRALQSRWRRENEGTKVVLQDGRTARRWDGERIVVERVG